MKYSFCSISFRHELVSFQELLRFAIDSGFSGIELWAVHANSLLQNQAIDIARLIDEMQKFGISIPIISDYYRLDGSQDGYKLEEEKWLQSIARARLFETDKIRIFAGNKSSKSVSLQEWKLYVARLRSMAELSSEQGVYTVIETHPNTCADRIDTVIELMNDVNHEYLRVNLDYLHLWESGCPPMEAYQLLKPWIGHFHLKNVVNRGCLEAFAPETVYSPNGKRSGIIALSEGAVNYEEVMRAMLKDNIPHTLSIEWFGNDPFQSLRKDLLWLKQIELSSEESKGEVCY